MPAERLSMRRIREILRLKFEHGLANRQIAKSCSVSRATVADYLFRAGRAGLTWPVPEEIDDAGLENLLFPLPTRSPDRVEIVRASRPLPDLLHIQKELHHPHVTLQLLWEEYRETYPDGYQYSHFCQLYRNWSRRLDVTLRQEYKAGDKLFVDYAGPREVKVLGRPANAPHLIHWSRKTVGISAEIEGVETRAHAAAGPDDRFSIWW